MKKIEKNKYSKKQIEFWMKQSSQVTREENKREQNEKVYKIKKTT